MSEDSHTSTVHAPEIAPDLLAAAALRRAQQESSSNAVNSIDEYNMRQDFRRRIDPGITRPNSKDVATTALKVSGQYSVLPVFRAHEFIYYYF
jgi:hypothetical protein